MSYTRQVFNINTRMQHNDGEPIYVCFDEKLTTESTTAATEALDEIFGLVNQINPSYHYTVIDKHEYSKLQNKTKIYCDYDDLGSSYGHIQSNYNMSSFLTNKHMYRNYTIREGQENSKDGSYSLKYLYLHELMHAFGINDVYSNTKFQGNTAIKTDIGIRSEMLSPNDFKILIALYAPPNANENDIARYKAMAHEYTQHYDDVITKIIKHDLKTQHSLKKGNYSFEFSSLIYNNQGELQEQAFEIVMQENKYTFYTLNNNHQIIDSRSGKVEWINGVALLKDVSLEHGLYPENPTIYFKDGFIDDFALLITDSGPRLTHFGSPTSVFSGILHETEMEIQQK
ncbi:MAG: hypothetical protein IJY90_03220 [Clostridia bacterium]|nr:hypothetical protein [Clostridia bacterium]